MDILKDSKVLTDHICAVLQEKNHNSHSIFSSYDNPMTVSAVLFLMGDHREDNSGCSEPCLILNKRSKKVKQPGDLCFPGGGLSPRLDSLLSKLLSLPLSPLTRWHHWDEWRSRQPENARWLSLFLATSLRESFEEMQLNPFSIRFLGPLPSQQLVMFHRMMYPMVAWAKKRIKFKTNWEVEKMVYIPLKKLLDPSNYARLRFTAFPQLKTTTHPKTNDFPCFLHQNHYEKECLWGATFRIVATFLEWVFGFHPPDIDTLPVIEQNLDETYLNGTR